MGLSGGFNNPSTPNPTATSVIPQGGLQQGVAPMVSMLPQLPPTNLPPVGGLQQGLGSMVSMSPQASLPSTIYNPY